MIILQRRIVKFKVYLLNTFVRQNYNNCSKKCKYYILFTINVFRLHYNGIKIGARVAKIKFN